MTDGQAAALRVLLDDVCSSHDADALAARWGVAEASRGRPGGLRVLCDDTQPFAALEVRPWSDDVTGVVDVTLRTEEPPLSWPEFRDQFGGARELPRLHGGTTEYAIVWTVDAAPAQAYMIVGVRHDRVERLTVRRDPLPA